MEKTKTEKEKKNYYGVALNNNIRHGHLDNSNGYAYFYGMNEKVFSMNVTENGKTVTKVFNMPIIAFEKDGKLYDEVTQKEIKYAPYYQADGQTSTYVKELSYSAKKKIEQNLLMDILKRYKINKDNILLYIKCLSDVEKYNLDCYNKTLAYEQRKIKEQEEKAKAVKEEKEKKKVTANSERKYCIISLNNNICGFSDEEFQKIENMQEHEKDYYTWNFTKDHFIEIFLFSYTAEVENSPLLFWKPKTETKRLYYRVRPHVLGFIENGKIYDAITKKEIRYAQKEDANGKKKTKYDYLTYSSYQLLNDEELGEITRAFVLNKNNAKDYAKLIERVEQFNHQCYLNTQKLETEKQEAKKRAESEQQAKLIRNREYAKEFKKNF